MEVQSSNCNNSINSDNSGNNNNSSVNNIKNEIPEQTSLTVAAAASEPINNGVDVLVQLFLDKHMEILTKLNAIADAIVSNNNQTDDGNVIIPARRKSSQTEQDSTMKRTYNYGIFSTGKANEYYIMHRQANSWKRAVRQQKKLARQPLKVWNGISAEINIGTYLRHQRGKYKWNGRFNILQLTAKGTLESLLEDVDIFFIDYK